MFRLDIVRLFGESVLQDVKVVLKTSGSSYFSEIIRTFAAQLSNIMYTDMLVLVKLKDK